MRARLGMCVFAGAVLLVTLLRPAPIVAQSPNEKVVETKGEVARGTVKLKSESRVNSKTGTPVPAPPNKGGEKARGGQAACDVHFDNRTRLWIKVWVDGDYEGLVPPYSDLYTWAVPGGTQLYARADFDDGSHVSWGPVNIMCPAGGSYTWRLYQ